ncbi:NAD-dependent epimerase/dehydratase family protein [Tumebacillus permanentifrigoris]|uniref:Nucleoside-diphosphate-sugar epimerase n=1 Tax=Tumebacillus permanentifrigoris TaxID=378543 RepID=A0A316DBJ0_9BACL|nr:NAD-dependent epimerase/dehydratase family protein [Tumebacillus permanentifrigoris]PWK13394.1 nucleoside-diphosphate-sugar epimerase [Tumebacillus permanentifrigoris]
MKNALVLGGTRFFGKRLVQVLLERGVNVTVATRGQTQDDFGDRVQRLQIDRFDRKSMATAVEGKYFDVVYDQICYGPTDAQNAADVFVNKVGRYVFTSTLSVYDATGQALGEAEFKPTTYPIKYGPHTDFTYQEGKRLAEAVFFQKADFPVVAVRIPIVLGLDDYTRRLHFHVEHVRDEVPFVMPNLDAQMNFIHAQEAAEFLAWAGSAPIKGPVNACANGQIAMRDLLALIEEKLGQKAIVSAEADDASPYGVPTTWAMKTQKAQEAGYSFTNLHDWLPQLVRDIADGK